MPVHLDHSNRKLMSRRYRHAALTHWSVAVPLIIAGALAMLSVPLERIRQPGEPVSDRDCSIFENPISIGRGRCLYLRRWISPRSSGTRFGAASPSRSGRERRSVEGDRGATLATCSTASCGCCGQERRGQTCRAAIRRTRRVTTASRSGSARVYWTGSWPRSPRTFGSAARST